MTKLAALSVYTNDLEKCKAFYTSALGFEVAEVGEGYVKLDHTPHIVLCPATSPVPRPTYPAGVVFGIPVTNLDEKLSDIRALGYEVLQQAEPFPFGRFGCVCDPDGNAIELLEFE